MRRMTAAVGMLLVILAGGLVLPACDGEAGEGEGPPEEPAYSDRLGAPDPGGIPGRALDACRDLAEDAPALSEQARDRIVRECEGAATGDEQTVRRAAEAACEAAAATTAPALARGPVADACKAAIP